MDNREWFRQAKYGMMIHWGLYSLIGGEWKGRRQPQNHLAEWARSYFEIPRDEYMRLTQAFNPVFFNAEEWVRTAKEAGMQYIVMTSKHHEGFAMFDSAWDDFKVTKTPFGRDVIAELAEACYKHGLKLGLYYSQEQDWQEPDGGGYRSGHTNMGISWTNDWDFPDNDHKNFDRCFEGKIKTQMKELLTKYGDLCLIWCDNPLLITPEQSRELYDMIKHYQPDCLVNSRIGNGLGDYRSTGDNEVDFDQEEEQKFENCVPEARRAEASRIFDLLECPATMNSSWGFKYYDNDWKSAEYMHGVKEKLNARGINYLLNVGPDGLGRIPGPSVDLLRKMAKM